MILTYYDKLKNSMCYLNIEKNKVTQFDASSLPKIIGNTDDGITYEPTNKDSNIITPTTSDINNQYNYNQIVFIPKATNKTDEPLILLNNKSAPIRIRPRVFYEERAVTTSLLEKTMHMQPNALIKDMPYILTFCGECWVIDSYVAQNALTFTGAVNISYDGSSEVSVEIPSTYGAQEIVIFSRDSVTFANNEDGDMAASINMPMPFTEAGVYRVKIGDRSGIADISQESIDDWNDGYNSNGYYELDLWGIFKDENNFDEFLPEGLYYYDGILNLYANSIEAGEYSVSITKVDIKPSIKMDKVNPTAIGSFSLNRSPGTIIGYYSHAEGSDSEASGSSSHAEGQTTTASGTNSHAEGFSTTASGNTSHAEGFITTASGINSHAEGFKTTASGDYSHAEGSNTTASGAYSHAEGQTTTALGAYSHAEGNNTLVSGFASHVEGTGTKASANFSHVQGKYNIEDSSRVYADIIGNGTSASNRSNAATIDWSGNAWYAGDVYVGSTSGTNKDEGSKKLATEEYVDNSVIVPAPSSADEEKVLRVVGGKATWVSLPSASGVSF